MRRRDDHQLVRVAAGAGEVVDQVGGDVEGAGAGAGDLAVQALPDARQELLGEGRQGDLAGDPKMALVLHSRV